MKRLFQIKHIMTAIIFMSLLVIAMEPSYFFDDSFTLNEVSDRDVTAPISTTYLDEYATEELQKEALSSVQNAYDLNSDMYKVVEKNLNSFFESLLLSKEPQDNDKKPTVDISNPLTFMPEEIESFLSLEKDELERMQDVFTKEFEQTLTSGVTEENVESIREDFRNNTNFYFFPQEPRDLLIGKLMNEIKPNLVLNQKETDLRKQQALESVTPVYKKIEKNRNVIREGDLITQEHLLKLEALGLIKPEGNSSEWMKQLPFLLVTFSLFILYIGRFHSDSFQNIKEYSLALALIAFVVLLGNFIQDTVFDYVPLFTTLMIFVVLWGRGFTIISSIYLSLLTSGNDFTSLSLLIVVGILLTVFYTNITSRRETMKIALLLAVTLSVFHLTISLTFDPSIFGTEWIIKDTSSFFVSSIVSSFLLYMFITPFEKYTGILTTIRLNEMYSNLNRHPLIEQLFTKAPQTYSHSVGVGSLAERAARKIGANDLLLKVGAMFHDVGKMENPKFFIENTTQEHSPHQYLTPKESAKVIREHPEIGVRLCKKHHLPKEIIRMVETHHSDSLIQYFFHKEKEQNGDSTLENDFRYRTSTPVTKEEGILLLADGVEAAMRTKPMTSFEDIKKDIERLVWKKVEEGDLRTCDLTVHDIELCIVEFAALLSHQHHKRIEYPKSN